MMTYLLYPLNAANNFKDHPHGFQSSIRYNDKTIFLLLNWCCQVPISMQARIIVGFFLITAINFKLTVLPGLKAIQSVLYWKTKWTLIISCGQKLELFLPCVHLLGFWSCCIVSIAEHVASPRNKRCPSSLCCSSTELQQDM